VNLKGVDEALLEYYQQNPEKAIVGIFISVLKKAF